MKRISLQLVYSFRYSRICKFGKLTMALDTNNDFSIPLGRIRTQQFWTDAPSYFIRQTTSTTSRTSLITGHTSKRPQQANNSQQSRKHHSDNNTRRSHSQEPTQGIMKHKTVFTTHKCPQQTATSKHNGTGGSHCQEPTQGIMIITSMSS